MIKIALAVFLILAAGALAEAGGPNWAQRTVINVDRMARDVHKTLFEVDRQKFFDKFMPVDNFRLYVKPNFKKSLKKGQAHTVVGFKFTF
jgi:hypothetical protein